MKKDKFEVSGEIYSITEVKDGKVEILLATETDKLMRVFLKRKNCNPYKWNISDFIKITGDISNLENSADGTLNTIEFSNAILKKLFNIETENKNIDYCSQFTICGDLIKILPKDPENYEITVENDGGVYTIDCDAYTLFNNIVTLDAKKKLKVNGVVYITRHHRYCSEGFVVSSISYVATNVVNV